MDYIQKVSFDFKQITVKACCEYGTSNSRFEGNVKKIINEFFELNNLETLDNDDDLGFFLEYVLLRLFTLPSWQRLKDEKNYSDEQLYIIIRKNLFLLKPNIRFK